MQDDLEAQYRLFTHRLLAHSPGCVNARCESERVNVDEFDIAVEICANKNCSMIPLPLPTLSCVPNNSVIIEDMQPDSHGCVRPVGWKQLVAIQTFPSNNTIPEPPAILSGDRPNRERGGYVN
jgi:hypothetical protein